MKVKIELSVVANAVPIVQDIEKFVSELMYATVGQVRFPHLFKYHDPSLGRDVGFELHVEKIECYD